ncbi:MAG: oligosaccharide flippase family protein [Saprospiraceae bacterium]|nr:oligosaccharide flippase family protein [Saprospiraceae bacterium]
MIGKIKELLTNKSNQVVLDQMVFSGSGFLTTVVLARILGPAEFGIYASVVLISYLIISIMNALVIQPFQVAPAEISDQTSYHSFTFWVQLNLLLILSVFIFIILRFNIKALDSFNQLNEGQIIYYICFIFQDYFRKFFLAKAWVFSILMIDILTSVLQIILLGLAFWDTTWTLNNIILWMGLTYLPGIIMCIIILKPWFNHLSDWPSYIKLHYETGGWMMLTSITQWWSGNLFFAVTGVFLGAQALGAFRLVQSVLGILNVLLQTFENYVIPTATRLYKQSAQKAVKYLQKITLNAAPLFGILLGIIFIFAKQIIQLAGGKEFADYDYVVRGMAVLYALIFLGYPIRIAIRMLLLNKSYFLGYLFSLLFCIASFRFLLNAWNLRGAIAGLIISQLIVMGYWQFILVKNKLFLLKKSDG